MYDLCSSLKCKNCTYQSKIILVTSALASTHITDLSSFQRSQWSPIYMYILFLFNLAFDSLFRRFLSESVNLLFGPLFELDFEMLLSLTTTSIRIRIVEVQQRSYEYGKSSWELLHDSN